MKTKNLIVLISLVGIGISSFSVDNPKGKKAANCIPQEEYNLKLENLRIRDPFIVVDTKHQVYYLQSNNNPHFKLYKSPDLKKWKDMGNNFTAPADFWGKQDFWAPDVCKYKDKYYLLATFSSPTSKRGTSILVANTPEGPYTPLVNKSITPPEWTCLDATIYIDNTEQPWLLYSREWLEVEDGQVIIQKLSKDLKNTIGDPHILFKASDAPWVGSICAGNTTGYVTDAPFIYPLENGTLIMLWSSFRKDNGKYAIGQAISKSGNILGPWEQEVSPLNNDDGGHAMLFKDLQGHLMISYHAPNSHTETPQIREVYIKEGKISF